MARKGKITVDYKELRKILNGSNMSVKHYQNGKVVVTDSVRFKGMPMSMLEEAQTLVEKAVKEDTEATAKKSGIQLDSVKSVSDRANQNIGIIMDCLQSNKPMTAEEIRKKAQSPQGIRDSIVNGRWNINNLADPSRANLSLPNIYISPWEANSLYSQKGIFETIINKKSKSILLNGCNLENNHLTQKQIDLVKEKMEVHNFKNILAEATLTSLVYGGALTFPVFKKDTPVTTALNLNALLKLGVLGKDCIDYFVQCDRWKTIIIPSYITTQKDFF